MTTKTITKFCLLAALGLASTVFNACGGDDPKPEDNNPKPEITNTPTTDVGVVINGVTWATRNVDAFGTFAEKTESAGMFYQWNRKKAWNTTDTEVNGWDETYSQGTTWEKANDPSPKGWRIPTRVEIDKLCNETKVTNEWTTQNGVNGRKFTDKATGKSLFLPAVGGRYFKTGMLNTNGLGSYWSSTPLMSEESDAFYLFFVENAAGVVFFPRSYGFSVRPVLAE